MVFSLTRADVRVAVRVMAACKIWKGLPSGPLKYLRIYEYEKGSFPTVRVYFQWIPCYHCEQPACVANCSTQAMYKEGKYGAVLVDGEKCNGCRICDDVCPYGAPVFESDEIGVKAQKCDMCLNRLEEGAVPICVLACPTRALDFGPMDALTNKYGDRRDLEDMPSSNNTKPSILLKPHTEKRQLVHYSAQKALELMARRDPLPPIYDSPTDVTRIAKGVVGRNELALKHKSVADLVRCTRNDEG